MIFNNQTIYIATEIHNTLIWKKVQEKKNKQCREQNKCQSLKLVKNSSIL